MVSVRKEKNAAIMNLSEIISPTAKQNGKRNIEFVVGQVWRLLLEIKIPKHQRRRCVV